MQKTLAFIAVSLTYTCAHSQLLLSNLLVDGDASPSAVPGSPTYRWGCTLPPCGPFQLTDANPSNELLIVGNTYRTVAPGAFLKRRKAIRLDSNGNQHLIAEETMPIPGRTGSFGYIFNARYMSEDAVAVFHEWKVDSQTTYRQVTSIRDGALVPIVEPGMTLTDGTSFPSRAEGIVIYSFEASSQRGALVAGNTQSGSTAPLTLYAVDSQGVTRIAASGGVDDVGLPIGQIDPYNLVVSDSGIVVVEATGPAGQQFVVYDGQSTRVLHRFDDLNSTDPTLELHFLVGPTGAFDVSHDGRICAIVSSQNDGVGADRLIEFSDSPPRIVYEPGATAPGGLGTILRIDQARYTSNGRLVARVTRSHTGGVERDQVLTFRSNGEPYLLLEAYTDYPSFSTGALVWIELGADDSIGIYAYRSDYRIDLVTGAGLPCPADTNHDGILTPSDFSAWVAAFNAQTAACDQNGDAQCTPADFSSWVANYTDGC